MGRRIRITAVNRKEPNVRLYALALLSLVRQLQEAEPEGAKNDGAPADRAEARHD